MITAADYRREITAIDAELAEMDAELQDAEDAEDRECIEADQEPRRLCLIADRADAVEQLAFEEAFEAKITHQLEYDDSFGIESAQCTACGFFVMAGGFTEAECRERGIHDPELTRGGLHYEDALLTRCPAAPRDYETEPVLPEDSWDKGWHIGSLDDDWDDDEWDDDRDDDWDDDDL